VFAGLWIQVSDQMLAALIDDPERLVRLGLYKGWAFVAVTSVLLLVVVRRAFGALEGANRRLLAEETRRRDHEAELQRLHRLYAALSSVNELLFRPGTRDQLMDRVCRLLVDRAGFRMAWAGWHDAATNELVPLARHGHDEGGFLASAKIYADDRPEGMGPTGMAFKHGRSVVANDLQSDQATHPLGRALRQFGIRAAAAFPIRPGGRPCGTLTVYASDRDVFGAEEIALLEEVATDVSRALEAARAEEERARAEAEANQERELVDRILESVPGVIYLYDERGRFVRWNRSFLDVTGYSPEELAGMTPLDFFRGDDVELVASRIGQVFASGEGQVEADLVTRSGRAVPHYLTGRRIELDGRPHLVGMGIDISDRREAQAETLELQRRLQLVVENLREGLAIADPHLDYLYWNPAALTLLGFDDVEEGARRQGEFSQIFELYELDGTSVPGERWPLARTREGETFQDLLLVVRRRDEPAFEKIISYAGTRVAYTDGRVLAFVTLRDVTASIRAERDLREAKAVLEQRVEERTADLRGALERAESADRLKSAFLATMSHELRTPLNSIIGFTGIVLQGLAGPLNAEQTRQLGMVRGSARHLLDLINDVLDLSKIEAGQLQIREEPMELADAVERVVGTVSPMAAKKGLSLTARVPPEGVWLVTDRRRVEQILLNLLNNAVKFTERGEVTLTVERHGDEVTVRVTDTGIGIKPEDLQVLFQPFRQVDTGLTRQHEGTGLGLAICRRLAGLLGGRIEVTSTWGRGSTFTLTLPDQNGAGA
jgi:PAS domain S-box-containing protein